MKIIKFLAIIGFISILTVSCEKEPKPAEKLQSVTDIKLPVYGVFEFEHNPQGVFPVVFKEKSYRGFNENKHSGVIKVFKSFKGNMYKAVLMSPKPDSKGNQFKTLFFKNIEDESVEIHQDYSFKTRKEAIDSKYPTANETASQAGPEGHSSFGWVVVTKSKDQSEPPVIEDEPTPVDPDPVNPDPVNPAVEINLDILDGDYSTGKHGAPPMVFEYIFRIGKSDDMFIFDSKTMKAKMNLERVFKDNKTGILIYKITEATGYYESRVGSFLTLYVRNISADGKTAEIALMTKGGQPGLGSQQGDALGKTIEEAKAIKAPDANKMWIPNMMNFTNAWIKTTRK